ncbi:RHS repeat protein, partial [Desulfurivibrio alkaliphilus]
MGYDYDPAGRLTGLVHRSGTAVIAAAVYDLDPVGNRLRLTGADQEIGYRYDRTHRLLEANPAAPDGRPATPVQGQGQGRGRGLEQGGAPQGGPQQPEFYQYDPAGNRQASHRHDDYRHDGNNRLLSADQARYEYAANGNLVSKVTVEGETSYRWDYANRLREVALPDGARVEFTYDPFGRRLEKRLVDPEGVETTTRYVYDHEDIVLETDADGHI